MNITEGANAPQGVLVSDVSLKTRFMEFWKDRKPDCDRFPAAQPVSLTRNELKKLRNFNYYVSVKSDGERFLLWSEKEKNYMVNRKFEFYQIAPIIEWRGGDTLFDGELIQNKEKSKWLYIVHDCISLFGNDLYDKDLDTRYQKVPYVVNRLTKNGNPFTIVTKKFIAYKNMQEMVNYASSGKIDHETDGYIFTPVDAKIGIYTQFSMFKWKKENTFDFKIVEENSSIFAVVRSNQEYYKFASISLNGDKGRCFKNKLVGLHWEDGDIVECTYNNIEETFHPYRLRKDKSHPNDYRVVQKTLANVKEDITEKDLIGN